MEFPKEYLEILPREHHVNTVTESRIIDGNVVISVYRIKKYWFIPTKKLVSTHTFNTTSHRNADFGTDDNLNFSAYMDYVGKAFDDNTSMDDRIDIYHCAGGICEEGGEIMGELNKFIFHSHPYNKDKITYELGDLMWYATALMRKLSISFSDVLKYNKIKLNSRYKNGRGRNYFVVKNQDIEMELLKEQKHKNEQEH